MSMFAWLKKLFSSNGNDVACVSEKKTLEKKHIDKHTGKIQAQLKTINNAFEDMEPDEIFNEWTGE